MKKIFTVLFMLGVFHLKSQQYEHCGTWRWSIKTITDDLADEVLSKTPEKTTINELNELKRPDKVLTNSPRFQDEKRLVTFKGFIIEHKKVEGSTGDHDYHIVVQSPDGKSQLITEIPNPECPEVYADENARELFTELRETYNEYIGTPSSKLKPLDPPVEVEITGIPFWDMPAHGGGHSDNGIEIHPITSIRVVNPEAAGIGGSESFARMVAAKAKVDHPAKIESGIDPINLLAFILLGAVLGMAGQVVRVAVGIKKAKADAKSNNLKYQQDNQQLLFSLLIAVIIGAIAGVLAGVNVVDNIKSIDKATIMAMLAAGYAGTDLIEGFVIKS